MSTIILLLYKPLIAEASQHIPFRSGTYFLKRAIAEGGDDPEKLANFARRSMKKKKEELELALRGYVNPHQRMMLKTILVHIDFLSEQIEMVQEVNQRVSSDQEDIERLDSIPGIATRMAEQILAE